MGFKFPFSTVLISTLDKARLGAFRALELVCSQKTESVSIAQLFHLGSQATSSSIAGNLVIAVFPED